mgnify:CR=1 FL=1|tara:strand:- start:2667 stop:3380 length:714 start_codon:yes stop_codon:yes gene_type:complete
MNREIIKLNRIKTEKQIFNSDIEYYIDNGIYLEYDKNDNNVVYILYIIKNDNIYKHSQHLFKFIYTENYPFEAPKLIYLTPRKKARLHPNFYSNGKCCLSLLGTWNGPGWTSCNNITSIINSIIPLFSDNPLQFEPTFEDIIKYKKYNDTYNLYVKYEIYNFLLYNINNMIDNTLELHTIMKQYFLDNYDDILIEIKKIELYKNKQFRTPVYNYNVNIEYSNLLSNIDSLYTKLRNT